MCFIQSMRTDRVSDLDKPSCYPCPCEECKSFDEFLDLPLKSFGQSTFGLSSVSSPSVSRSVGQVSSPVVSQAPSVSSSVSQAPSVSSPVVSQAPFVSSPVVSQFPLYQVPWLVKLPLYQVPWLVKLPLYQVPWLVMSPLFKSRCQDSLFPLCIKSRCQDPLFHCPLFQDPFCCFVPFDCSRFPLGFVPRLALCV